MLKKIGVQVVDCLVYDVDPQFVHLFLQNLNIHYKLRVRDDPRIESTAFFEETLTISATLRIGDVKVSRKRNKKKQEKSEEPVLLSDKIAAMLAPPKERKESLDASGNLVLRVG